MNFKISGFSYLALSTTAAFMQHLILYFWNRFEVTSDDYWLITNPYIFLSARVFEYFFVCGGNESRGFEGESLKLT